MTLVLVGTFVVLLLLGMPIAFALGIAGVMTLVEADIALTVVPQRLVGGTSSFTLLAVPFFILAGELMHTGGLSARLVRVADRIVGHIAGGLGMVTVMASMFFAAISGSAPATTAAIGSVMIPEMEERGYRRDFAAALATAAGPIGQLIPPSIPMVIWGVMANVSISDLFLAGIGPGIVIGAGLMLMSYVIARKEGWTGHGERPTARDVIEAINDGKWALLAPVLILGGIYGGVFTPTEAAAVSVLYGLLVGLFIHKAIKWRDLPQIFIKSLHTTTMVIFVIAVAALFGWLMANMKIGDTLVEGILSITTSSIGILLLINILLLILGMMMDNIAAMVILAGVLTNLAAQIDIDPVQFGAIVVMNFAIGMATPPVGYALFVGSSVSGLTIEKVSRAIWPLLLVEIVALLIITYVPAVTLFFANL